jgi:hypothetical protein
MEPVNTAGRVGVDNPPAAPPATLDAAGALLMEVIFRRMPPQVYRLPNLSNATLSGLVIRARVAGPPKSGVAYGASRDIPAKVYAKHLG